ALFQQSRKRVVAEILEQRQAGGLISGIDFRRAETETAQQAIDTEERPELDRWRTYHQQALPTVGAEPCVAARRAVASQWADRRFGPALRGVEACFSRVGIHREPWRRARARSRLHAKWRGGSHN